MAENLLLNQKIDIYNSSGNKTGETSLLTDTESNTSESPVLVSFRYSFNHPARIERVYLSGASYHDSYTISFYKNHNYTGLISTYHHSSSKNANWIEFFAEEVGSVVVRYNSNNGTKLYTFDLWGSYPISKYLIQEGEEIKTFLNDSWSVISESSPTQEMFEDHGMNDISHIPPNAWNSNMTILCWSNLDETKKAFVETSASLYSQADASYKGLGVLQTEAENLDYPIQQLIVNAEYEKALFEYSLDTGETWNSIKEGILTDITQEGNQLIIRISLPEEDSLITSLAYAWA